MRTVKPEPLLMLVLVVGLGILISTTVQAQEHTHPPAWHQRGAQLAMVPVRSVMLGLKLEWADEVVQHPAVGAYFSEEGLMINDQRRPQDTHLSVGWKPLAENQWPVSRVGGAFVEDPQPGVYFRLQQRW